MTICCDRRWYDRIDDRRVWDAIQNSLPKLLREVQGLLAQAEGLFGATE